MKRFRFPKGVSMADWKNYAKEQGWKYPEHAGELNENGDYYCVICATRDPMHHNEETHKDYDEWQKEFLESG